MKPQKTVEVRCAYTATMCGNKWVITRADEEIQGHTPCVQFGAFEDYNQALRTSDALNKSIGLSDEDAAKIVGSTMRHGFKLRKLKDIILDMEREATEGDFQFSVELRERIELALKEAENV